MLNFSLFYTDNLVAKSLKVKAKMKNQSACMAAALLLISLDVSALETLELLPQGDRISGSVVAIDIDTVSIETAHSGVVKVARSALSSLKTSEEYSITLASGEVLVGQFIYWKKGMAQFFSRSLGRQSIPVSKIVSARPLGQTKHAATEKTLDRTDQISTLVLSNIRGRGDAAGSTDAQASTATKRENVIGERPDTKDDIRLLYLRQSSVLLPSGGVEAEFGFEYRRSQYDLGALRNVSRHFTLPVGIRVGLANRWQGFLNVPFSYNTRKNSLDDEEVSTSRSGIGDISGGLNYQWLRENRSWPDVVLTTGFVAPSGKSSYDIGADGLTLGSGHWATNIGLQFVKSDDPVAIYWGVNYSYRFSHRDKGVTFKPGDAYGYNFGMGFAINDRVSFNGEFNGAYQKVAIEGGKRVVGSAVEPMQLRLGIVYRASKQWYLAPTLNYGLNADAPEISFGLSVAHRY